MKPRNAKDLKELNDEELSLLYNESVETYSKQTFQHALKQLHDTSYLRILRQDIARINTILNERSRAKKNG